MFAEILAELIGTFVLMMFGTGVVAMVTLFGTAVPGEIVKGTVYKQPFQCPPDFVPQIENRRQRLYLRIAANAFLRSWRACSHGGD